MNKLKVMSVFGTRPEAIKMAPLVKALQASEQIESIVCLTGQHREMLDSVMEIFQLTGDYDLHIMEKRQTLSTITTKTLLGMDEVLDTVKPDLVLVHGDTSTTFAGALAAFYHQVKVGHVEAGLRTWDKYSPFPEEMNRTLVGDIADLHFSPTRANAENLRREAIMGDIFITGNTAIDAMRYTVKPDFVFPTQLLNELDFRSRRVIAVTCHRRENYGKPMEAIMHAILELRGVDAVFAAHIQRPRAAEAGDLRRRAAQLGPQARFIQDPPPGLRRRLAAERKEIGKHDTLLPLYRMRRPRDPPRFGRIIFIQKRFINILDISLSRCIMKPVMREAAADRSRARIRREPGV